MGLLMMLLIVFFIFPFAGKIIIKILRFLSTYSSGITALSALLAVIFGVFGLDAWKKKLKGKTDYDIARQYLKSILQLRDALKFVRNPFISASEIQTALKENGFNPGEYDNSEKVNKSVYSLRWNKVQDLWTILEAILLEAEISWGAEAINIQKGLESSVKKLRGAIWLFINASKEVKTGDETYKLIYNAYDVTDDFSIEVDKEIEKIRDFLKQYL